MHDIGYTKLEAEWPAHPGEYEGEFEGEYEGQFEGPFETEGEGEFENESSSPFGGALLSEAHELELAGELLELSNEQELEQFIGDVFRAVGQGAASLARSDTGRAIGGLLKDAVKDVTRKALPVVGRAIGDQISSGSGGDWGARAGTAVGDLLGLELEGLSSQDSEFEIARQIVRFVSSAINQAAASPRGVPPALAARRAVQSAAGTFAPGLVTRLHGRSTTSWPRSGRWVRRGRSIVLYGS